MAYDDIEVTPVAGACGADVGGVDLAQASDDQIAEIRQALLEHLVLRFRKQRLSPDQHKALGRRFGELNVHPHYHSLDGHPEILPILKEPDASENIGGVWHADVTFLEHPAMGSLLYALEVPPAGGDTLFVNQYLAYDGLSDGMKAMLDGLAAVHTDTRLSRPDNKARNNAQRSSKLKDDADVEETANLHPVVRRHPETGRKGLFVNRAFTRRFQDMSEAESRALLDFLWAHAVRPEYTCRMDWEKDTLVFWDNRAVLHHAVNDYPGQRRTMHRVTIEGDRPV